MGRIIETAAVKGSAGGVRNWVFFSCSGLVFIASAAGTILWCGSMAGGMPMPGGWTMSMAWMPMPGQPWFASAASFMGMWLLMMAAMMLPSIAPVLAGYGRSLWGPDERRWDGLAAMMGAGYFLLWAAAEMRWAALARNVPLATGIVVVIAGCYQLTAWKARQLGCCRVMMGCGRGSQRCVRSRIHGAQDVDRR